MSPFRPPLWLRGATRQTIAGTLWPAPPQPADTREIIVELSDGDRLLLLANRPPSRPRGRLLLLHGLGGCAGSRDVLRLLRGALARGWEVIRLNARGSGAGLPLARHLPHAGRWRDIAAVLAGEPFAGAPAGTPRAAVGFSLGGAVLMRYLGETGSGAGLDAAVAVNPPTDLALCLQALERPANALYHLFYTRALRHAMRRRARIHPDIYAVPGRRHRSVRAIDEDYVAPDAGFASAEAYYAGSSARAVMPDVHVPSAVLSAEDDPFVPAEMLRRDVDGCRSIRLSLTRRGGHVGYLEQQRGRLVFWAADAVLDSLETLLRAPGSLAVPC